MPLLEATGRITRERPTCTRRDARRMHAARSRHTTFRRDEPATSTAYDDSLSNIDTYTIQIVPRYELNTLTASGNHGYQIRSHPQVTNELASRRGQLTIKTRRTHRLSMCSSGGKPPDNSSRNLFYPAYLVANLASPLPPITSSRPRPPHTVRRLFFQNIYIRYTIWILHLVWGMNDKRRVGQ